MPADSGDYRGLLRYRHSKTLSDLKDALAERSKSGSVYDAWMKELSDEIQHAARAYGEYICTEAFLNGNNRKEDGGIMHATGELYLLHVIKSNAAWFMLNGVDQELLRGIFVKYNDSVRRFDHHAETWVEAFMIPEGLIHAPIARDWCKYNEYDNFGEVIRCKY